MQWSKGSGYHLLLVGLVVCFGILVPGCGSLHQTTIVGEDDRWVCPEFADLPLRQGLFEEAIQQHLRVLAGEPDNALAHYHLGYAYGRLEAHYEEVAEYLKAIDLGLMRDDLFYNLGMTYGELGAYKQAEQALARAVSIAPDNGENHRALGVAYYHQERFLEAIDSCRQATILEPDNPNAWHCLALALAGAGRIEEARAALEQLRQLDSSYPLDTPLLDLLEAPGRGNESP